MRLGENFLESLRFCASNGTSVVSTTRVPRVSYVRVIESRNFKMYGVGVATSVTVSN